VPGSLTAGLGGFKGDNMEHFEIRQQVKTVGRSWLETIYKEQSLRMLEMLYEGLVKNNPDEYFELVQVTHNEKCLAYTPEQVKKFAELIAAEEREAIVALAASQGWAMKNEDPFEDAVRDICTMRSNVEISGCLPKDKQGNAC